MWNGSIAPLMTEQLGREELRSPHAILFPLRRAGRRTPRDGRMVRSLQLKISAGIEVWSKFPEPINSPHVERRPS